jgi:hypothetical protein
LKQCHASGVVATVFQATQAIEEDRESV